MKQKQAGKGNMIGALILGIIGGVFILSWGAGCLSLGAAMISEWGVGGDGLGWLSTAFTALAIVGMVAGVFAIIAGAVGMKGRTAGPVLMLFAWLMAIVGSIGINPGAMVAAVLFFIAMILGFVGAGKAKRQRNNPSSNNNFNNSNQGQW
ncbi:MAG: hypothetical protein FWE22_04900 [Firmicutes bacterium]|nr:hypothetical protein [Bacillota bacterium]